MIIQEETIGTTTIKFFDDYIENNPEYLLKNMEILVQNFLNEYIDNN